MELQEGPGLPNVSIPEHPPCVTGLLTGTCPVFHSNFADFVALTTYCSKFDQESKLNYNLSRHLLSVWLSTFAQQTQETIYIFLFYQKANLVFLECMLP